MVGTGFPSKLRLAASRADRVLDLGSGRALRSRLEADAARLWAPGKSTRELETLIRMAQKESCFRERWRSDEWLVESVADSLAALQLRIVRGARRVVDLGSGAGFPGLVLAHARRKAHFVLVEREPDRASFLERAVAEMGLTNVDVVTARADLDPAAFGGTDLVVSRSVASQDELLTWAAPLLAPSGACVQWGPRDRDRVWVASDPEAFAEASTATGIHLIEIRRVQVSESMQRHLFVYVRSDPTRLAPVDRSTKSGLPRTFVPDPPIGLVEGPQ